MAKTMNDYWAQFSSSYGGENGQNPYATEAQWAQSNDGQYYQNQITQQAAAEQKRIADLKAQGLDADGKPIAPDFISGTNADGTLQDKFKIGGWENVNADTGALDMYKQTAMRDAGTNSPWAKLMLDRQGIEQAQAADQAGAGASSSMLQAASRLAQSGGISGGARERMARQASQQGFIGRQQVQRQGLIDRAGILTKDEEGRMSGLKDLQGMNNQQADIKFKNQQQASNINQFNTTNLLKATDANNQFNQEAWKQKMQTWGAGKTADAQARAAGGGGKK